MKSQGLLKNATIIQAQSLKPLFAACATILKQLETVSVNKVRDAIITSSETIEELKLATKQQLPPLYGVGGTGIGGY